MKKYVAAACLLLAYSSCYKANNPPLANVTPVFEMQMQSNNNVDPYSGGDFTHSLITLGAKDSSSLYFLVSFHLISGNPENYPITCFVSGMPSGVLALASDTTTFRLSYNPGFSFSVNSDTGVYTFNINVLTPDSLKSYPVQLHVY